MSDTSSGSARDPVDRLFESFLARWRRGDRPSLEDYAARCPERADEIRELFPAMIEMEELKPAIEEALGPPVRTSTGPDSACRPAPPHPDRLGHYRILRVIGEGGMGVVYEAEHESLKKPVALKVMHKRLRADPSYLERFRREARAVAGLQHTNIVPVFDFGEHDGILFYAMQYIPGFGLDRVLDDVRRLRAEAEALAPFSADGPGGLSATEAAADPVSAVTRGLLTGRFATAPDTPAGLDQPPIQTSDDGPTESFGFQVPDRHPDSDPSAVGTRSSADVYSGKSELAYFREVARLGAQVADALDYAHHRKPKVVHRDIKPSNLLLDAQGNIWVTDFGLAKLVEGDVSESSAVAGTLRFMAPERFQGITDPRCDIYALGATLYEMLTLRSAFPERDQVKLIRQIAEESPTPLCRHDPRIPRDLETIVLKVLSKDPEDRCARASELRDELRRFLEGRPTRWRRVGPVEQFRRWCRRNPWLAAANITAAVLTTILAIVSTIAAWSYRHQRDEVARYERESRAKLFDALASEAQARRYSRRPGQRFDSLDALKQAAQIGRELGLPSERFDALRDEAIAAMALPDMKPDGRSVPHPSADMMRWAFDPAITRYAVRYRSGEIVVRRAADDRELARFRGRGDREVFIFGFSPDGRYLASGHFPDWGVTVWDVDRGKAVIEDPGPIRGFAAEFSPDGRRFLVAHENGQALLYDLTAGRADRRWSLPERTEGLAFRPDGVRVAAWTHRAEKPSCQILDVETGRVVRTIPIPSQADWGIAWSPDGTILATPCEDRDIYLWDAATGTLRGVLKGHTGGGLTAGFHPAGTLLASYGHEGRFRLWEPQLGRPALDLIGGSWRQGFGPDGRIVIATGTGLTPYRVDPALEYRTLAHPFDQSTAYSELAVQPGGRLLAVGTDAGLVLWDLARGTELALLPLDRVPGVRFADSGDLVTSGTRGVFRWPIRLDPDGHSVRIGPPRALPLPPEYMRHSMDRTGRVVALPNYYEALLHTPERDLSIGPLDDCRGVAVSPDGQWLATGTHSGLGTHVWKVADGSKVADLPTGGMSYPAFSPDGRYLMTKSGPCRLWEVGTWAEARRIGDLGLAFTPDGRALVVQDGRKVLRLVECATGRTLARFENPDQFGAEYATFSPDGSRLIVSTHDGPSVHVWDLRAIRRKLAGMGLDWDAPTYPEADPADPSAPPLSLAPIDLGPLKNAGEPPESTVERTTARLKAAPGDAQAHHERGHALTRLKRFDEAIADFTAALNASPNDAHLLAWRSLAEASLGRLGEALADGEAALRMKPDQRDREPLAQLFNNLAWKLVTDPAHIRNPARALELARLAVELTPDRAIHLNTLGVALYRAGRHAEAVPVLERSLAAGKGEADAFDLFFLAMARRMLGQVPQAQADFDRAVRWRRDHPNLPPQWTAELNAFQAEAKALLDDPPPELPTDVFAPDPPDQP